jgi:hypothetical protein
MGGAPPEAEPYRLKARPCSPFRGRISVSHRSSTDLVLRFSRGFNPGSSRTAMQERHSLRHLSVVDLDPAAIDRSERAPLGETLFGRYREELVCLLV